MESRICVAIFFVILYQAAMSGELSMGLLDSFKMELVCTVAFLSFSTSQIAWMTAC